MQLGTQWGVRDYARDQESRDGPLAATGIYGTESEGACELACLARGVVWGPECKVG